jgi:hypothetical protein
MSHLRPDKLHVEFMSGVTPEGPLTPRCYTLTHSDRTGDLFLSIGSTYNRPQISGWYTRFLRDEVLAEWVADKDGPSLHVHCHVSGGLVLGTAGWRNGILRYHMPMVLEALRFGDQPLYKAHPELDNTPIQVHFHATQRRYNRLEPWGVPADYRLPHTSVTNGV